MADDRAMEEQMERENPVNPKGLLHNRRETAMRNVGSGMFDNIANYVRTGYKKDIAKAKAKSGSGATPSMGLSQFRGGKKHSLMDHIEHPMKGFGAKEPSEAHSMGKALSAHIGKLHGKGFWDEFGEGFKQGFKGTMDVLSPVTRMLPGGVLLDEGRKMVGLGRRDDYSQERDAENSARYNKMMDESGMRGMSQNEMRAKRLDTARREGIKPIKDLTHGMIDALGMVPGMSGVAGVAREGVKLLPGIGEYMGKGSKTGRYEGKGRKRRAPAGANDGRRKRAEIVRKVMAEKGMKMIEASKYVKEHGLY
jgi:hypothetical protein